MMRNQLLQILVLVELSCCVKAFSVSSASTARMAFTPRRYFDLAQPLPSNSMDNRMVSASSSSSALFSTELRQDQKEQEPNKNLVVKVFLVAKKTLTDFASGYMCGYVLSLLFGVFQGAIDQARCSRWGLMFAPISGIYGVCDASAKEFFGAPETSLWNVVTKSTMTGFYLGRQGGILAMIRTGALYGAMTYFMTKRKITQLPPFPVEELLGFSPPALDVDFEAVELVPPALDVDFEVVEGKGDDEEK